MGRFWTKVDKKGGDDCWPWKASRNRGYGRFWPSARIAVYAHRYAWERVYGPIPKRMKVLHTCDNPPCCNPRHLFLGTQAINVADMVAKGRDGFRKCAKLTEAQVKEIRGRAASGRESNRAIARAFNLSHTNVNDIAAGRTWQNVQ